MAEIEHEFVNGTIEALFVSRLPRPFLEGHRHVSRFFDDPQAEEERYPELPMALFKVFEQAREQTAQRWNDPNWSMLLWGRREIERQRGIGNIDPWRNGLEPNRKNIDVLRFTVMNRG